MRHTSFERPKKHLYTASNLFLSFSAPRIGVSLRVAFRDSSKWRACFRRVKACLHGGGGPQIGKLTWGGSPHLSCKRDQLTWEIIWTGGSPHQSGLPHLPGVPHLYVNRPFDTYTVVTGDRPASSCLIFDMPLHYSAVQHKPRSRDYTQCHWLS